MKQRRQDKIVNIPSNIEKPHKKKSKSAKIAKRAAKSLGKIIVSLFLVLVITGSIVVTALTVYVMKFVDPDAGITLSNLEMGNTTVIYAANKKGDMVAVDQIQNGENREWVDLEKVPQYVQDAFICTEDERFNEHDGVDWKRTFAAFANLFFHFYSTKQGGSTITQQVIKNITGEDDVRIERKVQEIFRAINLEKKYTKDEILEAYLNLIYLNRNTRGIQAASKLYFNKDVSKLTKLEACALAGMTRNPAKYDPVNHPEANAERREYVIDKMAEFGKLTTLEAANLKTDTLKTNLTLPAENKNKKYQSYFVDNLMNEVIADLVEEKGYSEEYASNLLINGGLRIYTSLDTSLQELVENKYEQNSTFSASKQKNAPESAFIVMDHQGMIKAVVGGRGEKSGNRILNRATQSKRSPGSSMKPIGVYAPAIEYNLAYYSKWVQDKPIRAIIDGKERDWPNNYGKRKYGSMPMIQALQRSLNTVPVQLCKELTIDRSFNFLTKKVGLTTLVESEKKKDGTILTDKSYAACCLGDCTYGTKLSELTAAYQIFANGGTYTKPRSYTKITDATGEVILENPAVTTRVISEETSGVMNKMLQRVVSDAPGTGTAAKLKNFTVAGKTGTSESSYDQLFVGITPYYIAGVWLGFDTPKSLDGTGTYSPPKVWKNVMEDAHKGLEKKDFEISDKVKEMKYCTSTGLIANKNCPKTAVGYYKESYIPSTCKSH